MLRRALHLARSRAVSSAVALPSAATCLSAHATPASLPVGVFGPAALAPARSITSVLSRKLPPASASVTAAAAAAAAAASGASTASSSKSKALNSAGGFAALGVLPELDALLAGMNITTPTEIQRLAIPKLLTGPEDAMLGAQTGTGKTLAFLLPVLNALVEGERAGHASRPNRPRALVIVPSRELAQQVLAVAKALCHSHGARFKVAAALGGESVSSQRRQLEGRSSRAAAVLWTRIVAQWRPAMTAQAQARARELREQGKSKVEARREAYAEAKDAFAKVADAVSRGETSFEAELGGVMARLRAQAEVDAAAAALKAADGDAAGPDSIPVNSSNNSRSLNKTPETQTDADLYEEEDADAAADESLSAAMTSVATAYSAKAETEAENNSTVTATAAERAVADDDYLPAEHGDLYDDAALAAEAGLAAPARVYDKATLEQQLSRLHNVDLLIGTPGRLLALLRDRALHLSDLQHVVVDEADFLLHPRSGFTEDLHALFYPIRRRAEDAHLHAHGERPACYALSAAALSAGGTRAGETAAAFAAANATAQRIAALPARPAPQLLWAGASLGGAFQNQLKAFFPLYAEKHHARALSELETQNNMSLPRRLRLSWVRTGGRNKVEILKEILSGEQFSADAAAYANQSNKAVAAAAAENAEDAEEEEDEWWSDGEHSKDDENDVENEDGDDDGAAGAVGADGKPVRVKRAANALRSYVPSRGSWHEYQTPVMVFCNSVASARAVQHALQDAGVSVTGCHGDIPPKLRRQCWDDFLSRRRAVMVATDLAGRGVDTRFLSKVINFDFPYNPVDFLHRAGRTARAAEPGHVISVVNKGDEVLARAIDRAHSEGRPITRLTADKDDYRPDVAPALRKRAAVLGVPRRDIERARAEQHKERVARSDERRAARREKTDEAKRIDRIAKMPWQRRGHDNDVVLAARSGGAAAQTLRTAHKTGRSLQEAEMGEQMSEQAKKRILERIIERGKARVREANLAKSAEKAVDTREDSRGRVFDKGARAEQVAQIIEQTRAKQAKHRRKAAHDSRVERDGEKRQWREERTERRADEKGREREEKRRTTFY